MADADLSDLILVLIALLFPPITALFTDGCGGQFCLNLLLTLLGFIPGLIHAIWLVYRQARVRDSRGRVQGQGRPQHYVAVNPPPQQPQGQQQPVYGQQQPSYGQQYPPQPESVPAPNAQYQNQPYAQPAYQPAHGKMQ